MPTQVPTAPSRVYRPRDVRASPLYRLIQDHLEQYLAERPSTPALSGPRLKRG